MKQLWTIFALSLLLCSTAFGQGVSSETHLGGCILLKPGAEAPADVYYETDIIRTDEFKPFTKKLSVYGITLIGRDDISDDFMRNVAKTIKEIFPQGGAVDRVSQENVIRNMYRYRVAIPLFEGEPGFSSEDDWDMYSKMKSRNSVCDIIMEGVSRQVMEVVEHILHHVTDVGLHYTFPEEWGMSETSKISQFMEKAIDRKIYDARQYSFIATQEILQRVRIQEFAYWVISTAWNLQEPYGGGGEEWTIKNRVDLRETMPELFAMYERTVGTIMVPPSLKTLDKFPDAPESDRSRENDDSARYDTYNIVFVKEVDGNTELFLAQKSSGDTIRLTNTPSREESFPTWSSDGRFITYVGGEEENPGIYVLDIDTGSARRVIPGFDDAIPSWSPDGKQMVLTDTASEGGRSIVIVDLGSGKKTPVPHDAGGGAYATWSKAGPHLVFEGPGGIYRTDTDGKNTKRLADNPGLNEWPAFSPDGTKVAYAAGSEEEKHLWVVNADGTGARQLSRGVQYGDAYPAWSPDGKTILFTASADDKTGIYEVNVKDGSTKYVMDGMMPDWRK